MHLDEDHYHRIFPHLVNSMVADIYKNFLKATDYAFSSDCKEAPFDYYAEMQKVSDDNNNSNEDKRVTYHLDSDCEDKFHDSDSKDKFQDSDSEIQIVKKVFEVDNLSIEDEFVEDML